MLRKKSRVALLVQYDPVTLHNLREILLARGLEVVTATNLRTASQEIAEHEPELMVIDIHVLGRNWSEMIPKLREKFPNVKTLFTVNGSVQPELDQIEEYQRWSVLFPPFSPQLIEHSINTYHKTQEAKIASKRDDLPKPRLPIRFKITLPYIFLALVIAVGGAYVITQVVLDSVAERFTNQLIESGMLSSESVIREEERLLEELRLMAHTRGLGEAISQEDSEQLRELLLPLAANGSVDAVEVITLSGESLLSLHHQADGEVEDYDVSRGGDIFGEWHFVERVLQGEVDSQGDKYAGLVRSPWGDYVYFSGPLYDSDRRLIGAILVGESLETIVRQSREATLAQVTIYTLAGDPITTTFIDFPEPLGEETSMEVLQFQDEETLVRDRTVADINYQEIIAPLELRDGEDVGLMGTALPRTILVRASRVTRFKIFGFVSLALALVILMGVYVANHLTRPLLEVVRAAIEVAKGNLSVKIDPIGSDEVTTLTHAFNRMVNSLHMSKTKILKAHEATLNAYDKTIEGWSKALELRDEETEGHTKRVTDMTMQLARRIGISEEQLVHVRRGALLHDIGKMAIPDGILNKKDMLTSDEWKTMRMHPVYAYEMLYPIPYLREALVIPLCHHEKWDGSGYPRGLSGEKIPLEARIFAVVDVWDALTSDRPYRGAWPIGKAIEYLQSEKGIHFDPRIVDIFVDLVRSGEIVPPEERIELEQF
jgi:putative nucleotidyltransferase with HDIG domain